MNQNKQIIFFGTSEFAVMILEKMREKNLMPVAVITAPDKPVGRKKILTPPPVKVLAKKYNISILQPEKVEDCALEIENLQPDLAVLAAYGQIIPQKILKIPKFGALNIHPSLLPKYRGASPIQTAILNGDQETGVTIILMDEKIDHGPIIGQRKIKISEKKITFPALTKVLANLGAELLIEILPLYLAGKIKPLPQDHSKATFTKIIKKEDGKIDWQKPAKKIERMIRAFDPWPGTYTYLKFQITNNKFPIKSTPQISKRLKIIKADFLQMQHNRKPGTVFLIDKKIVVACGKDVLVLKEVQLEGKKRMTAQEFLNGHPKIIESILQ